MTTMVQGRAEERRADGHGVPARARFEREPDAFHRRARCATGDGSPHDALISLARSVDRRAALR